MKYLSWLDVEASVDAGAIASAVVEVTDRYGRAAADTLSVMVTDAAGDPVAATGVASRLQLGAYRIDVTGLVAGVDYRVWVTGSDMWLTWAPRVDAGVDVPDLAYVKEYLRDGAAPWSDDEIADALATETGRQRDACTIPLAYPAQLREALCRRVQRNLAMRALPLAYRVDGEGQAVRMSRHDPVIKEIEDHYPKAVTG